MKAFVSLHFLTESRIHRNHQRLLTMVRTILGQYMGVGWHVFRTAKGVPNTAGSLLDGLTQLATEIEVFMQEPMKAYKVRPLATSTSTFQKYIYIALPRVAIHSS